MSSINQAYKQTSAAQTSAGRQAAQAAKSVGEDASEFASDLSRRAEEQLGRAQDMAVDVFDQTNAAVRRNPMMSVGIALGLGFLLGVVATTRR